MLQLRTQQQMTSQIRSHIEYVLQTSKTLTIISYSNLMRNVAAMTVFNYKSW